MSNRIQLLRTTTASKVPTLAELLDGELALNITDQNVFARMGQDVVQLNAASFLKQDSTHRLVTDTQIATWSTPYVLPTATASILGGVKVGQNITVDLDGTIHIPTADGTATGVLDALDYNTFMGKQDALGYVPVNKAGDTMAGSLVLAADPTVAMQAATKNYVDNGLVLKVDVAGSTMTGALVLASDPTLNLEAATKQYVDLGLSTISGRYAAPVADVAELTALPSAPILDRQLRLVESNGTIYRYDVQATDVADGIGVITPTDIVSGPGRWIKVQAATQNHNNLVGLQGGAAGDYLHLTTSEKNSYDAHLIDTALHVTALQSTWLDSISATATEVNTLVGVTSSVQTQLNNKQADLGYVPVNVAGDTMLGNLTLFADPTASMHAVTKQYLESYVVDCGTF
jgi:hypothetical protein